MYFILFFTFYHLFLFIKVTFSRQGKILLCLSTLDGASRKPFPFSLVHSSFSAIVNPLSYITTNKAPDMTSPYLSFTEWFNIMSSSCWSLTFVCTFSTGCFILTIAQWFIFCGQDADLYIMLDWDAFTSALWRLTAGSVISSFPQQALSHI